MEGKVSAAIINQGLAVENQRESTRGRILDHVNRRFYGVQEGRDGKGMELEVHPLPKLRLDPCP